MADIPATHPTPPTLDEIERRATDRYLPLLAIGFAGYLLFGKSFAYLGVPPLFVGEILFLLGLLAFIASGCASATLASVPALCCATLLGWVVFRTVQGIGPYKIDALRDGAVTIYAGFAFVVTALLLERPARLAQVVGYFRIHARILVPAAIMAYIVARGLGSSMPKVPGTTIDIISVRSGELAAHLTGGLVLVLVGLCSVGRLWLAIAFIGAVLVASQNRGGMLALIIPVLFAMVVTGQFRRLASIGAVVTLCLGLAYALDFSIDTPRGERPISTRAIIDNMASIVMPKEANNLDDTKQWRLNWWESIRNYTLHGPYFWTGKGFGINLAEADGFMVGLEHSGPLLRSPHSVHMTYLARGGVPGLVLWVLTCASWIVALLRASRHAWLHGERDWSRFFVFLVSYFCAIVINASFDVALEGPMLGIPFWILFGVGLGSLMIYRGLPVIARREAAAAGRRTGGRIAGLVALLLVAAPGDRAAEAAEICPAPAIRIAPGASIQAAVDKAPPGTAFCIEAGLHRLQIVNPKDRQVFIGEPGAILSGSELVGDIRRDGRFWVTVTPRRIGRPVGSCLPSRPACNDPVRFFLDDQPLEPVARLDDLKPGTIFHDRSSGSSYLADDPTGRKLERTQRAYAFWSNGARDVVVRGLIVEKYATPAQQGAIFGDEDARASGWLIEGNEVRLNSGGGISTGDRAIVRGNRVHHNGQLGISPNGGGVLIEGNEIYANNIYGFDAGWEAGGVKAGAIATLTMRGNNVHDNYGSGLWCDVDCRDILIENNLVERNADAGIFYEISTDAVIRNNTVRLNGTGAGGQQGNKWMYGAGIQIAASERVQVYGNSVTVAQFGIGIMLIDQGRERVSPPPGLYRTAGNIVRDNEIIYEGRPGLSGGASDVARTNPNFGMIETGQNHFDGNSYVVRQGVEAPGFIWGGDPISFEAFRALGQETGGRLVESK